MIPFVYRLRREVRFEQRGHAFFVISEIPLNVVRVSETTVRILRLCDGVRTPEEIAWEIPAMNEGQVYKICDYFNKKAVLEAGFADHSDASASVTVVIPVKDREGELAECLGSVFSQDYPENRIEVIVIDDGSTDRTRDVAARFPCKLLPIGRSRGQSYSRNLGAREAHGEILAFLDSDCVASVTWLKALVPYFQWDRVGAVGGYVDGYFQESALDRYEKAFSPLNMGKHLMYERSNSSTMYVPTCNLLVRKAVYVETGGLREGMHVGEDVDFCWRMRKMGFGILYVPAGVVEHKHRNGLGRMAMRRAQYGTSEALLYALHDDKKKTFQVPPLAAIALLSLCISVVFSSVLPVYPALGSGLLEAGMKTFGLMGKRLRISPWKTCFSVLRSYFSFFYFASFHVVRYYMVLFLFLGVFFHPFWCLGLSMLLLSSSVDYHVKRPQLSFPVFLFFYAVDHISYQLGVFAGCLRHNKFGSYTPRFVRKMMAQRG